MERRGWHRFLFPSPSGHCLCILEPTPGANWDFPSHLPSPLLSDHTSQGPLSQLSASSWRSSSRFFWFSPEKPELPGGSPVKNPPAMLGAAGDTGSMCEVLPWVGKIPWRRAWQPTPIFLPGESPWTEQPGGLQSIGSQRVGHTQLKWFSIHARQRNQTPQLKPHLSCRC